jgi:hypothetical protein
VPPELVRILARLRESRFADLKGARVSAAVPISERLLNELVRGALPPSAPVHDLSIRPEAANRLTVSATMGMFAPTATVEIERQPEPPNAVLVLRISKISSNGMPLPTPLATAFLAKFATLPPGLRLEGERLSVDLRSLIERRGFGEIFAYLESVRITTEEGRLLLDLVLRA